MKLIRPSVPGSQEGRPGHSGAPQNQQWRKEWIANQPRNVELICGHMADLHDKTLLIIGGFKGTTVLCEQCNEFVSAKKTSTRQKPAIEQNPLPPF